MGNGIRDIHTLIVVTFMAAVVSITLPQESRVVKKIKTGIVMARLSIIICCVFFSSVLISQKTQHIIPIPTKKEYPIGEDYFEHWVDDIRIETNRIDDVNLHWENRGYAYREKFNCYFKALTDKPSDILLLFLDAFEHNPHEMCDNLTTGYMEMKNYGYARKYYATELKVLNVLCDCHYASYNQELIALLKQLNVSDQKYRNQNHSDITEGQWLKQNKIDSINELVIHEIVDTYGFPDRSTVGVETESILVTIILHSSLETMKKYLPIIKEKVDNRLLPPRSYPLLYDRIEWLSGRPQLYGTQSVFKSRSDEAVLYEVKNPENLKERRALYNLD